MNYQHGLSNDMGRQHSPTDDLRDLRAVFSETSSLTGPESRVLAVLILHRNGETGRIDPSVSRIASKAGMGRSTVIRSLAALEAGGWLTSQKRSGIRTRYAINIPTGPTTIPVPQGHRFVNVQAFYMTGKII